MKKKKRKNQFIDIANFLVWTLVWILAFIAGTRNLNVAVISVGIAIIWTHLW